MTNAKHTRERFEFIVKTLNDGFKGSMVFELVGSLTQKGTSDHDADIVVHTTLPVPLSALKGGFAKGGTEIVAVDRDSKTPFPGRPDGQDRIQIKMQSGEVIDLFYPKGLIRENA